MDYEVGRLRTNEHVYKAQFPAFPFIYVCMCTYIEKKIKNQSKSRKLHTYVNVCKPKVFLKLCGSTGSSIESERLLLHYASVDRNQKNNNNK